MDHTAFNPEPTSTGIRSGNRVIGYSAAIRLLDNGRYDKHLAEGMEILACIMEAVESNWITLNIEKQIIVWRWLLAAVFITEELEKNGTVDVPNDTGGVDTAVIYSASMAQSASIRDRNALHSLTILRLAPLRNTGQKVGSWRCGCIRTWLLLTKNLGSGCQHWPGGLTSSMTALSNTSRSKVCQKHRLCIEGMMMNNLITNKPSMTSLEIAELVEKRHDNVKRTIET
jgi:hypothetical protein